MSRKIVNILLVEDNEVEIEAIKRAFRKYKISNPLFTANNGIEALEMLRGNNELNSIGSPRLILLDLNMPKMDGLEFLKVLRNDPELSHTVVFVLTTSDDEKDRWEAYDKHIAGYMVKSSVGKDFINLVDMLDIYWKVVEFPEE